jgi:hypothetical protein
VSYWHRLSSFSPRFPDEPLSSANDDTQGGLRPPSENSVKRKLNFGEFTFHALR